MEHRYMHRIADKLLLERLEASGAVLVEGPKWCGKTRTSLEIAKSHLFMQDPDKRSSYLKTADGVLDAPTPLTHDLSRKVQSTNSTVMASGFWYKVEKLPNSTKRYKIYI